MNKIQKFAISASILLALALIISCSSDDDKGGGYLTCEEAAKVISDCDDKREEIYASCLATCGEVINGDYYCIDNCQDTTSQKCLGEKGLCGGSSAVGNKECFKHYETECYFVPPETEEL